MTQFANTLLQLLANLSQCSLHTVAGHYHPVPLVCTPGLKQLSGQPTLHHNSQCSYKREHSSRHYFF